ncbi:MAG: hypothetical protein HZA17_08775 [Nitrospirae bacterium]|nr:hypothetical protein [Nitrospirota bacterium]
MQIVTEKLTKREKKVSEKAINRSLCPFIMKPFDGCYCTSTSSLYTEATIFYCGGNYKQCEIYGKKLKEMGGG